MGSLTANPIRQLVCTILVVSMSLCCCQAQFLLHGLSDETASTGGDGAPIDPISSGCCPGCADETPDDGDDEPAPQTSCKTCCVKGTGMKDGVQTPTLVLAVPFWTTTTPVIVAQPRAIAIAPLTPAPHVAPPTLLRLRCALIV